MVSQFEDIHIALVLNHAVNELLSNKDFEVLAENVLFYEKKLSYEDLKTAVYAVANLFAMKELIRPNPADKELNNEENLFQ